MHIADELSFYFEPLMIGLHVPSLLPCTVSPSTGGWEIDQVHSVARGWYKVDCESRSLAS